VLGTLILVAAVANLNLAVANDEERLLASYEAEDAAPTR
jgi:hypothetical protein